MRILLLDIETAPNTAFVWGMWDQNVGLNQLIQSSYVLCWAAKWYGEKEVFFDSVHQSSTKKMLKGIHKLVSEADAVIHWNGTRFDMPTLNKEFILAGMLPPAPYKEIDLMLVAKRRFRFTSNKLDYVAQALKVGRKHNTTFELWVDCMKGDEQAWKKMESYNRQDTLLLEGVYDIFKPWIKSHANVALYDDKEMACPNCGSPKLAKRGFSYTALSKYQRYQCGGCGNWCRSNRSLVKGKREKFTNV